MAEQRNGTVTATGSSDTGGRFALVSYPAIPAPPPPGQEAHEEVHSNLTADEWTLMRDALADQALKVNVTTDATNEVTAVIVHR